MSPADEERKEDAFVRALGFTTFLWRFIL